MANILSQTTITTAVTSALSPVITFSRQPPRRATFQANFVYGSNGTNVTAYVQTSFDGGSTWSDIACFQFTTSSARKAANLSSATPVTTLASLTDGSLTANTCVDGLIGDRFRVKYSSTGTYAGSTSLQIDGSFGF